MLAAREKADGVAKLLIEAKVDLDATEEVRPVGGPGRVQERRIHACMHPCMHACMHACAEVQ